ncbi:MAG: protocatechuate 3,4-dioxygenase [Vicinamibacteria bacterium]
MPEIPGTYVFTGERSQQGYRLNRLSMTLTKKEDRERFLADEEAYMREMGLTDEERDLVRRRDWGAIIRGGGNIYLILKIAATVGSNLLDMGAQMRGESLEALMASRPGPKAPVMRG